MNVGFFMSLSFGVFAYLFYIKVWPVLVKQIDDYIRNIQENLAHKQQIFHEQEQLKIHNQKKLHQLEQELEAIQIDAKKRLELLTINLEHDLERQYQFRQNNFQQTVQRMLRHQKQVLKDKFVEAIFRQVEAQVKNDLNFEREYMVHIIEKMHKNY